MTALRLLLSAIRGEAMLVGGALLAVAVGCGLAWAPLALIVPGGLVLAGSFAEWLGLENYFAGRREG